MSVWTRIRLWKSAKLLSFIFAPALALAASDNATLQVSHFAATVVGNFYCFSGYSSGGGGDLDRTRLPA